jgi:hypothetical protein
MTGKRAGSRGLRAKAVPWAFWALLRVIRKGGHLCSGLVGVGTVWVRFASARRNVAFCCAVLRRVARSGDNTEHTETQEARRGGGDWGCRSAVGSFCTFSLSGARWRGLAGFGRFRRAVRHGGGRDLFRGSGTVGHFREIARCGGRPSPRSARGRSPIPLASPTAESAGARMGVVGGLGRGRWVCARIGCLYLLGWWCAPVMNKLRGSRFSGGF